MKKTILVCLCVTALLAMSSCNSYRMQMREPNAHVEFYADDFELSEPFTSEFTVTHVLGINWEKIFGNSTNGYVTTGTSLPVVGPQVASGANGALYRLMEEHPGYDVIFYPQVKVKRNAPVLGTGLYSKTTYTVTARLGKMRKK